MIPKPFLSRRSLLQYGAGAAAIGAAGLVVPSATVGAAATARGDGEVLHVSVHHGDDANPGTRARPCRTIGAAYALAQPGDTVLVAPGTYREPVNRGLNLGRSGTADAPITVRSHVRWAATINTGAWDNIIVSGDHNVLDGFDIQGGTHQGIAMTGNDNVVANNHIHHNGNIPSTEPYGQDGILSDKSTRGNQYLANYIDHNGRPRSVQPAWDMDHGMYLQGDDELVANNIIVANRDNGIQVAGYDTISNLRLYNNVIAGNGHAGLVVWLDLAGVDIVNNIFAGNGTYRVDFDYPGIYSYDAHGTGVEINHNLFHANPGGSVATTSGGSDYEAVVSDNVEGDPLFVNEGRGDYRVQLGSPVVDAGQPLAAVRTDFSGAPRPRRGAWDIGAYERR